MNCNEARGHFAGEWAGELSRDEAGALAAHLSECVECRADSLRLRQMWSDLGRVSLPEPREELRNRFHSTLAAYEEGLSTAKPAKPKAGVHQRAAWPIGLAAALLLGLGIGYGVRERGVSEARERAELAELRSEVTNMRQLVVLSMLQQQSATDRLRGVRFADQMVPSDGPVLSALLDSINHDPNVNVRLAAADALHGYGSDPSASKAVREAVSEAVARQSAPLVQIALIDLLVDLRAHDAQMTLRSLAQSSEADPGVRERANWALERLQ